MSGTDAPEPSSGEGDHFPQAVRDPAGTEYFVEATVAYGGSGPIWIGHKSDPFKSGRLLGLMNRALARMQRPHHAEAARVIVTREQDQAIVLHGETPTAADAFQRAEAIATQIEAGSFRS